MILIWTSFKMGKYTSVYFTDLPNYSSDVLLQQIEAAQLEESDKQLDHNVECDADEEEREEEDWEEEDWEEEEDMSFPKRRRVNKRLFVRIFMETYIYIKLIISIK